MLSLPTEPGLHCSLLLSVVREPLSGRSLLQSSLLLSAPLEGGGIFPPTGIQWESFQPCTVLRLHLHKYALPFMLRWINLLLVGTKGTRERCYVAANAEMTKLPGAAALAQLRSFCSFLPQRRCVAKPHLCVCFGSIFSSCVRRAPETLRVPVRLSWAPRLWSTSSTLPSILMSSSWCKVGPLLKRRHPEILASLRLSFNLQIIKRWRSGSTAQGACGEPLMAPQPLMRTCAQSVRAPRPQV